MHRPFLGGLRWGIEAGLRVRWKILHQRGMRGGGRGSHRARRCLRWRRCGSLSLRDASEMITLGLFAPHDLGLFRYAQRKDCYAEQESGSILEACGDRKGSGTGWMQ